MNRLIIGLVVVLILGVLVYFGKDKIMSLLPGSDNNYVKLTMDSGKVHTITKGIALQNAENIKKIEIKVDDRHFVQIGDNIWYFNDIIDNPKKRGRLLIKIVKRK